MTAFVWFDAPTGISGDMAVGSLLDLGFPVEEVAARVRALGVPGVEVGSERTIRGGLAGTRYRVDAPRGHDHRGFREIAHRIHAASLGREAEAIALDAFERLAAVEARLHGTSIDDVHFHEVGAADAMADVVGFAVAYAGLGLKAGEAAVSPLPLTRGRIAAAHGSLPLPAPATMALLEGFTWEECGDRDVELVTPTGAALLAAGARPGNGSGRMTVRRVGYGAGTRELAGRPNLLRTVLAERAAAAGTGVETAALLEANVDDMNPQLFGPLVDRLRAAGALDVWMTPVQMKKGRPGVVVSALAPEPRVDALAEVLFRESTTIGLRVQRVERRVLERESHSVETEFGEIRVKVARRGGEIASAAPEFDDVRDAADRHGVPVRQVLAAAHRAIDRGRG